MRRLRMFLWTRIFLFASKLQNKAIVKRSEACGCNDCTDFARMIRTVQRVQKQLRANAPAPVTDGLACGHVARREQVN
jgi:hypothetical protein